MNKHDHLVRKDGGKYDEDDFQAHPEQYTATFAEKVGLHWAYTGLTLGCSIIRELTRFLW